jgi:sodium-dependent dicarboxylate transporter 2/3/5
MSNPIQIDAEGNLILKVNWKRMLKVALILAAAVSSYFLPIEGLTYASRITMMIFIGAAGFWVTEAIPPFATAIMVVVLNIYLLGQPGGALGLGTSGLEIP